MIRKNGKRLNKKRKERGDERKRKIFCLKVKQE